MSKHIVSLIEINGTTGEVTLDGEPFPHAIASAPYIGGLDTDEVEYVEIKIPAKRIVINGVARNHQ